jgi:cysteinyl-tRNA synthetase
VDEHWLTRFNDAMADDFNTPLALAVLFELSHAINKTADPTLVATLKHLSSVLGLLTMEPVDFLCAGVSTDDAAVIDALIAERRMAKQVANWAQADAIRQQLTDMGIDVEDGPNGSTWRRVR